MKPASLQDAIKAAALQKQKRIEKEGWKEPVIKINKVTTPAANMRITPSPALNGSTNGSISGSANNHETPTMAMKRQMEDLKKEMQDLKSDMKKQQSSSSSSSGHGSVVEEKKDADNDDISDLRAELKMLREKLKEAEVEKLLPRMKKLYIQVKELDSQMEEMKESSSSNNKNPSESAAARVTSNHTAELKQLNAKLAQDYAKLHKEKADASELDAVLKFCSEQDNAIKKHLNEIKELGETIQKQQKTIEQQDEAITENQREIELLKCLVRDVAKAAQEAKTMAEKASKEVVELMALKTREEVDKPMETSISLGLSSDALMANDDSVELKPKVEHPLKSASDEMQTASRGRSTSKSNLYAADDSSDTSEKAEKRDRQPSRSRSRRSLLAKSKLAGGSDSCAQFEADAAGLFHSKSERKIVSEDDPLTPKPKKGLLAPFSPKASVDDDLCFSSKKSNKSMSDLKIPDMKSYTSFSSSDGESSDNEATRKKTINLMPHRSEKLYEEQRKDSVLRRFMSNKGKTPNMSVRTVHGHNLVFFSDRIYIPSSMRDQTMDYYKKKYKYSPISALERNCFWPDMKTDMRNYNPPETRWRISDAVDEV